MNRVLTTGARRWRCGAFRLKNDALASVVCDKTSSVCNSHQVHSQVSPTVQKLLPNLDRFTRRHIGPRDEDKTAMLEKLEFRVSDNWS